MGLIVLLIVVAVAAGVIIANATLSAHDRRRPRHQRPAPIAIIPPSGPAPASASDDTDFALLLNGLRERWRHEAPEPHVPYPPTRPASPDPAPSPQHAERSSDGGWYADHSQPYGDHGGTSDACDTGSSGSLDSGDCESGGDSFD
jgi:hypothetical protein